MNIESCHLPGTQASLYTAKGWKGQACLHLRSNEPLLPPFLRDRSEFTFPCLLPPHSALSLHASPHRQGADADTGCRTFWLFADG